MLGFLLGTSGNVKAPDGCYVCSLDAAWGIGE